MAKQYAKITRKTIATNIPLLPSFSNLQLLINKNATYFIFRQGADIHLKIVLMM